MAKLTYYTPISHNSYGVKKRFVLQGTHTTPVVKITKQRKTVYKATAVEHPAVKRIMKTLKDRGIYLFTR